jgi:hypothetical protein
VLVTNQIALSKIFAILTVAIVAVPVFRLQVYGQQGLAMVAELARVRFFVAALKSGDSSYPKI